MITQFENNWLGAIVSINIYGGTQYAKVYEVDVCHKTIKALSESKKGRVSVTFEGPFQAFKLCKKPEIN